MGNEAATLLTRNGKCPVCGESFTSFGVKAREGRLVRQDIDLRAVYDQVDKLKYSVTMCPYCGYAARLQNFDKINERQKTAVKEKITGHFSYEQKEQDTYSYDEALLRYELAVACAAVMDADYSEQAYLCLMAAWTVRGLKESLDAASDAKQIRECEAEEQELLRFALGGFLKAISSEEFPMCGMDEGTVDYLVSALYYETGNREESLRMLSRLLASNASPRLKDRARDLKDQINEG